MKKKLLFAAAMLLAAVGVNAQTDVTSTYLTNAGFDTEADWQTGNVAAGGSANSKAISEWTGNGGAAWSSSAAFAYNGGGQINGADVPATYKDGNAQGGCLGVSVGWSGAVTYYQEVTLPAGNYTLSYYGYNNNSGATQFKSLLGFYSTSGAVLKASSKTSFTYQTWEEDKVSYTINEETTLRIQVGGQAVNDGSGKHAKVFFDGLTLTYMDPLAAVKAEYEAAITAANTALKASEYSSITGTERSDLESIISAVPVATETGYTTATEAITEATAKFKAAKGSYDELAEINAVAAKLGLDALSATNGAEAIEKAHVQNVAVYNKVNDDYTFPVTLGNSWTTSGATQQISGQHWDGTTGDGASKYYEPNQWGSGSVDWAISQTLAGLPAGDYVLMATGRHSVDVTMTMSAGGESVSTFPNADSGFGVDTSGDANFGEGTYANGNNGRGWQWRYVPFTLTEAGNVEIKVTATAPSTHQWASICEFRLLGKPEAKVAIAKAELLAAINDARAANNGVNVGTDAFQIPASAVTALGGAIVTAQAVYDNESATLTEVEEATTAIIDAVSEYEAAELNAPAEGDVFNVILKAMEENYAWDGKVMTLRANERNGQGNYNFQYNDLNENYAQKLTFTKVEGNNYTISISADAEGVARYITTGTPWGGNNFQIRTSTNADDAAQFTIIPTATEGIWNIWNVAANQYVGSQDAGVYTVARNYNFQIEKNTADNPSVGLSLATGKFATRIYPFKPAVANNGVKYYSCAAAEKNELTLVEVAEPAANVPYILEATVDVNETLTGVGAAFEETYTDGFLTGVFAPTTITEGYVLQTQEGKQAFYIVNSEKPITVPAYRAYLTVSGSDVKSFNLGDDTTGISALEALTNNAFEAIYSADGVKLNRIEKGVNILKMSDGTTRKVILK